MKLTAFILLVCFLQVSASVSSQTVSFSGKNIAIEKLFSAIEQQTGFVLFFSKSVLKNAQPVTIDVRNMPIVQFLELALKHQPFDYRIADKTIMLSKKDVVARAGTSDQQHSGSALEAFFPVTGIVKGPDGQPLIGATVQVKGKNISAITDEKGFFSLNAEMGSILIISYVGYQKKELRVDGAELLNIPLAPQQVNMDTSLVVVNTGYQNISKERSTGSFVHVDNQLLNRSVSTNALDRLANIVPGLIFDNIATSSPRNQTGIFIRGQSVISTRTDPLIVIDNFPYEGDLSNINPNDIESISVLKDAAAASIWGARAGNGVIVITTKKGGNSQKPKILFNSNMSISAKPNLYYLPKFSAADYIDIEKSLFASGYYTTRETSINRTDLTPVVELLIGKRDRLIDAAEADRQIEEMKNNDVRKDYERYFLQNPVNEQYSLSISGGTATQRYFLSGGYDRTKSSSVGNTYDRITLNASNNYSFFRQKLEVGAGIYFTSGKRMTVNSGLSDLDMITSTRLYPYADLADEQGNALSINKYYRQAYLDTAGGGKLLDWNYRPLDELGLGDNSRNSIDYRINLNLKFKIFPFLYAEALYQYNGGNSITRNIQSLKSYDVRDLINKYSSFDANGNVVRPVPLGGIQDFTDARYNTQSLRTQMNFNYSWHHHELTAIAGWEVRDQHDLSSANRFYGYDEQYGTTSPVNYTGYYTLYHNQTSNFNRIVRRESESDLTDRFRSYYANASYTFKKRYTAYGSSRIDQSNLFGVKTNQKSVPLWSAGLGWHLNAENFYHIGWLPMLKLRASYGYAGNVDKTLSAYTTAAYGGINNFGYPYATILNPPNPQLRWEQIGIINMGIDFGTRGNRITGSLEYYQKKGRDLIGQTAYAPQTGITAFKGNTADTKTRGVDITLNTINLKGAFQWNTVFIFSLVREKVTNYYVPPSTAYDLLELAGMKPNIDKPLYGMYSYRWAGLDPQTGNPMGYNGKEASSDYSAIYSSTKPGDLVYHGPGRPTIYGALRNGFYYKGFSFSANIIYRMSYFVRKETVKYVDVLNGRGTHGDYNKRWQQPGDEKLTEVPSQPAATVARRDDFIGYASNLVSKGDQIRLQDMTAGYDFAGHLWKKSPFGKMEVYLFANNVGLLWKANKWGLDPESLNVFRQPAARSIAIGFRAEF